MSLENAALGRISDSRLLGWKQQFWSPECCVLNSIDNFILKFFRSARVQLITTSLKPPLIHTANMFGMEFNAIKYDDSNENSLRLVRSYSCRNYFYENTMILLECYHVQTRLICSKDEYSMIKLLSYLLYCVTQVRPKGYYRLFWLLFACSKGQNHRNIFILIHSNILIPREANTSYPKL